MRRIRDTFFYASQPAESLTPFLVFYASHTIINTAVSLSLTHSDLPKQLIIARKLWKQFVLRELSDVKYRKHMYRYIISISRGSAIILGVSYGLECL